MSNMTFLTRTWREDYQHIHNWCITGCAPETVADPFTGEVIIRAWQRISDTGTLRWLKSVLWGWQIYEEDYARWARNNHNLDGLRWVARLDHSGMKRAIHARCSWY